MLFNNQLIFLDKFSYSAIALPAAVDLEVGGRIPDNKHDPQEDQENRGAGSQVNGEGTRFGHGGFPMGPFNLASARSQSWPSVCPRGDDQGLAARDLTQNLREWRLASAAEMVVINGFKVVLCTTLIPANSRP
jgi:hypothetical protein